MLNALSCAKFTQQIAFNIHCIFQLCFVSLHVHGNVFYHQASSSVTKIEKNTPN